MEELKTECLPEASGLTNIGQTCYFNSMLQALISCTSLSTLVLKVKDSSSNQLLIEYSKLLTNTNPNQSITIWETMMRILVSTNKHPHFRNQQQDSHESLQIFLDLLSIGHPEINDIFNTRYRYRTVCHECKFSTEKAHEDLSISLNQNDKMPETLMNRSTEITDYRCGCCTKEYVVKSNRQCSTCRKIYYKILNNKKELMCNECQPNFVFVLPSNYKNLLCEVCKVVYEVLQTKNPYYDLMCKNCKAIYNEKKTTATINYRLTKVSPVIIVLFNKYQGKYLFQYPNELTIGKEIRFTYQVIAQVEHSGGMEGGHYWAIANRKNGTFTLNDSSSSPGSLTPTESTYLVFYHLVSQQKI